MTRSSIILQSVGRETYETIIKRNIELEKGRERRDEREE